MSVLFQFDGYSFAFIIYGDEIGQFFVSYGSKNDSTLTIILLYIIIFFFEIHSVQHDLSSLN